jgi:hypothetical protein
VTSRTARRGRRFFAESLTTLICFYTGVVPVAAHGTPQANGMAVSLPIVIVVVTTISAATGFITVAIRNRFPENAELPQINRIIGVLFITIGAATSISILLQEPVVAISGGVLGIISGIVLTAYEVVDSRPKLVVGAITVHRLVEGSTLAALSAAGDAIGVVSVIVLILNTVFECISIGLYPRFARSQALGAILIVTAGFVVGLSIGTVGLTAVTTTTTQWIIASVAGLLIIFGTEEARPNITGVLYSAS